MDLIDELQAHFGDAYRLERELGGGGMSRVFLATETRLGRQVVIKVLGRELAEGLSTERFTREITLAARLQDPHIVPVYAAGTTSDGLPYFTMPFVDGESLRARLAAGALPFDEGLRILRDVAEALEYAHARGVVHRDIKPDNVLLAGRNAVVADFGIAKALSAARTLTAEHARETLTSLGMSIGTPAYMAPEQAAGDPDTDHRADLYAWGILAYEVLTGVHPFAHRRGAQQLLAAQLAEEPKPLVDQRAGLPPALSSLVMQCLAKTPDHRPTDATALLSQLAAAGNDMGTAGEERTSTPVPAGGRGWSRAQRVLVMAVPLLLVAAGVTWMVDSRRGAAAGVPREADSPTIAVLPFVHEGDTAAAYVTEGIADEIRGKLMGVRDLTVIARASSNQYRATKRTPQQIAEELGVRYLLTGSVRVVGSGSERRVLVRPELVEVTADGRLQGRWGQPFDVAGTDLVSLQGAIGEKVVGAMEVAIGGGDRRQLVGVPTRDGVAYDLYLRARASTAFGADRSVQALTEAQRLLEEAVQRDSTFIEAWGELTLARADRYVRWSATPELAEGARRAAERTKALDPAGGRGDRALGIYLMLVRNDVAGAQAAYERAYRAAPGEAAIVNNLATTRSAQGRVDEALTLYERASRLDPRNVSTLHNRAGIERRLGNLSEARALTARVQSLAPSSPLALRNRMDDALYAGDTVGARRILAEALRTGSPERLLPGVLSSPSQGPLLDPTVVRAELARGPVSVGGDRAQWAWVQGMYAWLRGDSLLTRAWGDTARVLYAERVRALPDDDDLRLSYAVALGLSDRAAEAMREVRMHLDVLLRGGGDRRSVEYSDALYGAAIAAAIAGEHEAAIAYLEEQRALPLHHSAGRLRVHPFFAGLRSDPRFQRLTAEVAR